MVAEALAIVGAVTFVLAWFVNAATEKTANDFRVSLSGYQAFLYAITSAWDSPESVAALYRQLLGAASAFSNIFLVAALWQFVSQDSSGPALRWALSGSAVLNCKWLSASNFVLGLGYYMWASSFFFVAAALTFSSR